MGAGRFLALFFTSLVQSIALSAPLILLCMSMALVLDRFFDA